ncbi:MAG: PucC family protein [Pseudomonadota bacterium]
MILRLRDIKAIPTGVLPFGNAVSEDLPWGQLLRLSLFQISVGMASVMLLGTLNRVMIVELNIAVFIVALMAALPVLIAPFRAFLGFRSDTHKSAIGWKRIPYIWFGSLWQFGGLAIMPFALLLLSGDQTAGPDWAGEVIAAVAFAMTGLGIHMTQTAGLALASDRASAETRPRVVAMLYVMFLIGMGLSAVIIGTLLQDFTPTRLVQVIQGCAVMTLVLNLIALWRQERVRPMSREERAEPRPAFKNAWAALAEQTQIRRMIVVIMLGTAAFSMQDVLLEPYGGEILGLSVSATTYLTAAWSLSALIGFVYASHLILKGYNVFRVAARGLLIGLVAFCAVIFAAPMQSPVLFYCGASLIGLGGGLFAVAMLSAAMSISAPTISGQGLTLGIWGAAQATALGLSIGLGGVLKDGFATLAESGLFGAALNTPAAGYGFVYNVEIILIFAALAALGPLVRSAISSNSNDNQPVGLADFPT